MHYSRQGASLAAYGTQLCHAPAINTYSSLRYKAVQQYETVQMADNVLGQLSKGQSRVWVSCKKGYDACSEAAHTHVPRVWCSHVLRATRATKKCLPCSND